MSLKAGLVGLPNVGKSTLFNALTKSSIPAENYPFCTVDPHVAITEVPDPRLHQLAEIFSSQKLIHATTQFVDIAGLVKGAAQGEGLGNQFLSNIMGVDLILHVVRCFEDDNITHVHNSINPLDDLEVICTELMLKDLESIDKRELKIEQLFKKTQQKKDTQIMKALEDEKATLAHIKHALAEGDINNVQILIKQASEDGVQLTPLLSGKNFLIVANVSEDDFAGQNYKGNEHFQKLVETYGQEKVIAVSAKIEAELAQFDQADADEMMDSLNINERGLDAIIEKAYKNLNMITFFTVGPKEAHAWSIAKDTKVPQAAGTIHSDMERGFICAEIYHCDDMIEVKSEHALKESGKIRTEGKEYIVQDGDVMLVRFNV